MPPHEIIARIGSDCRIEGDGPSRFKPGSGAKVMIEDRWRHGSTRDRVWGLRLGADHTTRWWRLSRKGGPNEHT